MSFIYEKSRGWRIIVAVTKHSKLAMVGFAAACVGITYGMAQLAMNATNPEIQNDAARKLQNKKPSLHQQTMARVNRERLAVLLEETRQGTGNKRYEAALRGESMGTMSGGTSVDARGYMEDKIKKSSS